MTTATQDRMEFTSPDRTLVGRQQFLTAEAEVELRRHLHALLDAGVSVAMISVHCQVNRKAIEWFANPATAPAWTPPAYRLRRVSGLRILAMPVPRRRLAAGGCPAGLTSAVGSARRLQALVAAGFPRSYLAVRLGKSPAEMGPLVNGASTPCQELAERIEALFRELEMTPGASSYASEEGRRRKWAPPMAWDHSTIDDPSAAPDLGGKFRMGFVEKYTDWRTVGLSDMDIARNLEIKPRSLLRQLQRYGLTPSAALVTYVSEERTAAAAELSAGAA